jgi:hypothetical protein
MDQVTGTEQAQTAPETATDATEAQAPQIKSVGRNVVLPSQALGRIKNDAKERGKREAMGELEQQAKAAGFSSLAEALGTLKGITATKAQGGGQQKPKQRQETEQNREAKQAKPDRSLKDLNRERDRYSRLLEQERRARQDEARRRRDLQRQLDAAQARAELEKSALQAGIQPKRIKYAVNLLLEEIDGKDEKTLGVFDESKFFEGLRESEPYLFGETVKPATTGTAGGAPPPMPKPGQVAQAAANGGKTDPMARDEHGRLKMNQTEFHEYLRKRGMNLGPAAA